MRDCPTEDSVVFDIRDKILLVHLFQLYTKNRTIERILYEIEPKIHCRYCLNIELIYHGNSGCYHVFSLYGR